MSAAARRCSMALVLVLALVLCLPAGAAAKKKKSGNTFSGQQVPNAPIPDRGPGGANAPTSVAATSTIKVPKSFKGRVVTDLNVTGIQITGTAGVNPTSDLVASLTAPNGRTMDLFTNLGTTSIGPMTIDDDTSVSVCNLPVATPCPDPAQSLYSPFAGTTNTITNAGGGFPTNSPLAGFNGLKLKGTWTFTIRDLANTQTSVLNKWGLRIASKPG